MNVALALVTQLIVRARLNSGISDATPASDVYRITIVSLTDDGKFQLGLVPRQPRRRQRRPLDKATDQAFSELFTDVDF